jgi:hypothetical protein
MNYTQIKTEISNILKRGTSLDSDIPNWITYAESQIESDLRLSNSLQTVTATLTSNTDYVAFPSTALEVIDVFVSISGVLYPLSAQPILQPSGTNYPSQPSFWMVDSTGIRFDCKADQNYTISIQVYGGLDIATTTTNWIGDNIPDVYIYGALVHSAVKTEADNSRYASMFDLAMTKAKRLNAKRQGYSSVKLRTDVPDGMYANNGYNIFTE